MSDFSSSISTKLVHVGRNTGVSQGFVNIPPFNGSTVLHHSSADMKERTRRQMNGEEVLTYGTEGGPTHDAFYQLMNELEGGVGTWAFFCFCEGRRPCVGYRLRLRTYTTVL